MATTSLTWTCSGAGRLVSCGVDSERIARFGRWTRLRGGFLPFVFTPRERLRCLRLSDPAAGLCAAFCVKEAMYKAIGLPYNFTDCEYLPGRTTSRGVIRVSPRLAPLLRGRTPTVKILRPVRGVLTAAVWLSAAP